MAARSVVVELIGEKVRNHYSISLNGALGVLRPRSFEYLAKLALGFLLYKDHWVHKGDLSSGQTQHKSIYVLRRELRIQYGEIAIGKLILNDCDCHYRLNVRAVTFDFPRLAEYPNVEIRDIEGRIKEIRK